MTRFPGEIPQLLAVIALLTGQPRIAAASDISPSGDPIRIPRADSPIRVDGILDDADWTAAPMIELGYEIMPGENIEAPVRTECRLIYDEHNLYVSFRAYDPRPQEIRVRLTDRDPQPADDQVGIAIDPFNDQRRAFQFITNPLGVQTDIFRNDFGSDGNEDVTWEAIWSSAGRITEDGYTVEIGIPFTAIRFPGTDGEQTWGFMTYRNYPRSVRHQLSTTPFDRGRNCFVCQFAEMIGFEGIRPGRNLEFDPTLTGSRRDGSRGPGSPLDRGPAMGDLGLSGRWAITPNLSLNGAINPDFSQVEADVQQLDVNNRFALFYPERRPFFQEGADFFQTPLNATYTRTVADPAWGIKLTGKERENAVGVFITRDEQTNFTIPSNQRTDFGTLGEEVTGAVLRYRRDVGATSAIGVLTTIREGKSYHNRVYGLDGWFRVTRNESIQWQALGSSTRYPSTVSATKKQPDSPFQGFGGTLNYRHESRRWAWGARYADLDEDFRADAGFIPRVDVREVEAQIERRFIGGEGSWVTEGGLEVGYYHAENHDGVRTDQALTIEPSISGPWQSYFRPVYASLEERFAGRVYRMDQGLLRAGARPSRSFNFWGVIARGDIVDYANARPATNWWGGPGFSYDFGRHVQYMIDHTFEDVSVGGRRLYFVNLLFTRLVYQMTARTYFRTVLQYEDIDMSPSVYTFPVPDGARSLESQLLFSYKVNPQSVLYLGYSDRRSGETPERLRLNDRTFFAKIGYAWQT